MVSLLFILRFLVLGGIYYALRKGRRDWSRILFIVSLFLAAIGYSLDGNWLWAALQMAVVLVFFGVWQMQENR